MHVNDARLECALPTGRVRATAPFLKHRWPGVRQAHVVWNCYKTKCFIGQDWPLHIIGSPYVIATILHPHFGANALEPRVYDSRADGLLRLLGCGP